MYQAYLEADPRFLMNLLGQNPKFHVTPTNDLVNLLTLTRDNWINMVAFKSQGIDIVKQRVINSMKGSIEGFFKEEFELGKIVFDKSRDWLSNIELIEEILGREVKILVTIRDIRAIVSSFEKLYRKSSVTKPMPEGSAFFDIQTIEGRAYHLLHQESVLGLSINRIRDTFNRGLGNRLIIIPFEKFTKEPDNIMSELHNALGIESFDYNTKEVSQITQEDDSFYGMDLHKVRKEIKYVEPDWDEILTPSLCEQIFNDYKDLINLAGESNN